MDIHHLLSAAVVLLAATAVATALFKRIGLGSVLGLLAAGVVVGPWGLAVTTDAEELRHIAEIGVVFLLFVIGLEMQPQRLWSMRRLVFGLGTLQVVFTGLVIGAYALLFAAPLKVALLIGLGLALSSTAFVMQMLSERGDIGTDYGRASFAVLLLQDIAIVPLLALVPVLAGVAAAAETGDPLWYQIVEVAAVLAAVVLVGRYLLPVLLRHLAVQRNREAFSVLVLLAVLGAAWMMDLAGLSQALGAFLVGMLLSHSEYRHQIEAVVEPAKGFLIGLFFLSVGMSIEVGLIVNDALTALQHVVVVIALKAAVLFGLCLAFGLGRSVAVQVALLLPQCGEFGFVLFGAAVASGLFTEATFNYLILVISITMVATPPLARLGAWAARRLAPPAGEPSADAGRTMDRHVIVAGYGRVGRVVCLMLEKSGVPYLAFDQDPDRVALGLAEGRHVHFGDIADPHVLDAAGVGRAAAVVVTLNDVKAAERLVTTIRNFYPYVQIHARAHNLTNRDELLAHGVSYAVPDTAEASLHLGQSVLDALGQTADDVETLLHELRRDGYHLIRLRVPAPTKAPGRRRRGRARAGTEAAAGE